MTVYSFTQTELLVRKTDIQTIVVSIIGMIADTCVIYKSMEKGDCQYDDNPILKGQRRTKMETEEIYGTQQDYHHTNPTSKRLIYARMNAGLSISAVAALAGITDENYVLQEKGDIPVSIAVYRLLLCQGGLIVDSAWEGWFFKKGLIWGPDGVGYSSGDILSIHWLDQSIRTLRAELLKQTGHNYDQAWFHGYRFRHKTGS